MTGATDSNGQPLTAALAGAPSHGTVVVNPDGSFTYTPVAGYLGPDSFTYQANDGTLHTQATVNINVVQYLQPTALAGSFSLGENGVLAVPALGVLAGAADPNGLSLSAVLVTPPSNGTVTLGADGSFVYVPSANFVGQDSFTYAATDGAASSSPATISLTILPVANCATYAYSPNTLLTVPAASSLLGADSGTAGLSVAVVNTTVHGTLTLNPDGSFTYQPTAGYGGNDTFTYVVSGAGLTSTQGVVTLHADLPAPPSAQNLFFTTAELKPTTVYELEEDSATTGATLDPTSVTITVPPTHGTASVDPLTGAISYTSDAGYVGSDSLTYTVNDNFGTTSNPATVSFTVVSDSAWQNPANPLDVIGKGGAIIALDALVVLNYLNSHVQTGSLPATFTAGSDYVDVLGTGKVVPLDALVILNYLNKPVTTPSLVKAATSSSATAGSDTGATGDGSAAGDGGATTAGSTNSTADSPSSLTPEISLSQASSSVAATVSPAIVATAQASAPVASAAASSPTSVGTSASAATAPSQSSVKPLAASASQAATNRSATSAVDSVLAEPGLDWLDG